MKYNAAYSADSILKKTADDWFNDYKSMHRVITLSLFGNKLIPKGLQEVFDKIVSNLNSNAADLNEQQKIVLITAVLIKAKDDTSSWRIRKFIDQCIQKFKKTYQNDSLGPTFPKDLLSKIQELRSATPRRNIPGHP